MHRLFSFRRKLSQLFSRYPQEPGVRPDVFDELVCVEPPLIGTHRLAAQSVADKFYFLLFGAIASRLASYGAGRAELVLVRAISGAVGSGWRDTLKRSALVTWLWTNAWVRAHGNRIAGIAYRSTTWAHPIADLKDWRRSATLWKELRRQTGRPTLTIDGIEVADLLIDSYLRFRPSPAFDVTDPFVRRLIWQALRDMRMAQSYFEKAKPKWYLTSYTTYLEHGIPARVALRNGVEVWSFGNLTSFGKRLSFQDTFHTRDFSVYRRTFDGLDRQEERLAEARQQLETRLSGGIDAATSYMRQSAYAHTSVELPPGLQGAAIVFLHDFYDSPHVYPDLVFDDFWDWACFTIEVLTEAGIPFFLKPHPNQVALSDQVLVRLQERYPNLQWLPINISNVALIHAGISCGITVYGTVAHELAYLGVPSITCARHPHHSFDFCRTAHTVTEYKDMLRRHAELPVPKEEMQRQALAFYYMHNMHGEADERELQQAFVGFWKACNLGASTEADIIRTFRFLVGIPGFNQFVATMGSASVTGGLRSGAKPIREGSIRRSQVKSPPNK